MQSIIKKVVLGCLFVVPFVVLHVADAGFFDVLSWGNGSGLFFPFISGKNLIFRFLVEIAFAGWVILALKDAAYRVNIKKTPLTVAYIAFISVLLVADIFGVDRERSLWSNFERMEGFVGHIHLFAYFFVMSMMLPTLKDWQKMWKWFIASNVLILIYATGQLMGAKGTFFADTFPKMAAWFSPRFQIHMSENRLDATIGNSAYFAVFCLMFVFIVALLWSQSKEPKKQWFYPVLIFLNIMGVLYSGTRGTMIGLMFGGLATLAIFAWKEKGKMRTVFAGIVIAMMVLVSSIFIFKDSALVKSSSILSRIATISPNDVTGSSRLSMWKISYEAWLERPLLGYGQDNFSYIFARKFLPEKMCNLEPWYDRSHNVFFDWLVAGGALGLLTYLSLYAVALWLMWRKENSVPLHEKAILTGAIIGYFIHNIFVFDNLTSYILFAALLAYIVVRTQGDNAHGHGKAFADDETMNYIWIPVVGIILVATQYYVNYRPLLTNRLVIEGMSVNQYAQIMPFADAVKKQQNAFVSAIAMNTIGSEEAREQFLQMGVRMAQVKFPEGTPEADKQAATLAINEEIQAVRDDITKSLPDHIKDVRMLSIYGTFYNGTNAPVEAEKILTTAREIAPNKQLLSFDLARSYLMQQKFAEAYDLSKNTYDLSITCNDAQKWLLLSAAYAGTYKEARAHIIEKGQTVAFDPDVLTVIVSTGQTQLAIELLLELRKEKPELASQVDEYIKQLVAQKPSAIATPKKK
ncbi:MAG: O-antigen ligase family protein [Candidatus Pacebacteria bacterium]|nr:O-antigen ligase family protein [Candidatus Paceibacterota bacterium]MBP9866847.1 O-antigen ligase family protein [Candidatus Paceibacterota bacterium]